MAEKRTIDINIKNNADEATKDFNHFNDALDQTAKSAKNVNSTFEEVYGELQPLTTRLGEAEDRLYELALAGDTTSKEYQELLTKVGEYRKVQIQTDLAVDGAATTMTQKLGSALNAATSGFAATQGAIALFGEENEALNESLLKVQSALAIQQGVQGLTEAYKELSIGTKLAGAAQAIFSTVVGTTSGALKVFRIALISTGIGAIVVGLGLLIANFDKVKEAVSNAIDRFRNLGPVMKALLLPITAIVEGAGLVKDALQALGVLESDEEEARKARAEAQRKRIESEIERETKLNDLRKRNFADEQRAFDRRRALLQAEGKDTVLLEQLKELNAIKESKRNIEYAKGQIERIRLLKRRLNGQSQEAKQFEQQIDAFNQAIKDSNQQILDSNNQLKINVINNNKEKADSYKQYRDTRLNIARQIEDLENELLEEGKEKELEINQDKFRRLREDAKRNTELTRKERAKLIELYDKQELAQQKVINQKYIDLEKEKNAKIDEEKAKANKERIDKEDALFELELSLMKDRQMAEIIALTQQYDKKFELANGNAELERQLTQQQEADIAAIQDKYRKEKIDKDKAASDKEKADALTTQQAKIQFANDALGAISDLTNAFAGESEKAQKKAFKINKAIGITQAIINTAGAVSAAINPAVGGLGIPAGLPGAVLAAATGAAQIATIAKTQFQGGGGEGVDAPPTSIEATPPQFNVVGDAGINQLAQLQQQPTQAYVVSGEVTSAQALDRNRVTNATL